MADFSVSKAWDETKRDLKNYGRLIIPIALAFVVLPFIISDVAMGGDSSRPASGASLLLMLGSLIVSVVGQLSIQWLSIGRGVAVSAAIKQGFFRAPAVIAAGILVMVPLGLILAPLIAPLVANPADPPVGAILIVLVALLVLLIPGARLSLTSPIGVAERLGPFAMLKRSWNLTRGVTAKLYGVILLFLIVLAIVTFANTVVIGSVLLIALGPAEPWSLSALAGSVVAQTVAAVITIPITVMQARIYVQLAGAPTKGI